MPVKTSISLICTLKLLHSCNHTAKCEWNHVMVIESCVSFHVLPHTNQLYNIILFFNLIRMWEDTHLQLGMILYRSNSRPEQSSLTSSALQQYSIIWDGLRYLIYDTKTGRLRTYGDWSHGMNPSPNTLSEAGFFYTGIVLTIQLFSQSLKYSSC